MRRRLDLAGVLMHSPRLLFLDEPTQGLDPAARRTIWDYLRKLNTDGSTIFLTTHHMEEADTLCRDLAFIDRGKIVQRGSPAELKAEMGGDVIAMQFSEDVSLEKVQEKLKTIVGANSNVTAADGQITLATPNGGELVPRLIQGLDDIGAAPRAISISQPSLEDVFVKLVGHSILDDETQLVQGRDPFVEGRR
jgi:ABC-2 type transport system ATP-binding protein